MATSLFMQKSLKHQNKYLCGVFYVAIISPRSASPRRAARVRRPDLAVTWRAVRERVPSCALTQPAPRPLQRRPNASSFTSSAAAEEPPWPPEDTSTNRQRLPSFEASKPRYIKEDRNTDVTAPSATRSFSKRSEQNLGQVRILLGLIAEFVL